jgi:hypothetical protein
MAAIHRQIALHIWLEEAGKINFRAVLLFGCDCHYLNTSPRGPFLLAASNVKNRRFLRWSCSRHFSSRGFGADDHRIGQFDPMTATKADGAFRNLFVDNNGVKAVQRVARRVVAFAGKPGSPNALPLRGNIRKLSRSFFGFADNGGHPAI